MSSTMNIRGALKKAQELFGPKATVSRKRCVLYEPHKDDTVYCSGVGGNHGKDCPGGRWLCSVGQIEMGMFNAIKGEGETWEEAFARIDYYGHRDYCRKRLKGKPCRKCDKLKAAMDSFRLQEDGICFRK